MAFRHSDLQEAFFVPGTHPFRVYGYGTADPLEQVLTPNYFAAARGLLRAGELIYVSTYPEEGRGGRAEPGEPRMALVMVRADARGAERASASVRLVQDFGRPRGASGTLDVPARRRRAPRRHRSSAVAAARPAAGRRRRGKVHAHAKFALARRQRESRIFRIPDHFSSTV